MPNLSDPNGLEAIGVLLTALGLSSVSGLRAYLPLLAVAVGSGAPGPNDGHLIVLSKPFQSLGSTWVTVLLVVLVIGEFIVDKIPVVDHLSDAVHTIIRPISGAIVMAGISNPVSNANPWVAAAVGAALAFTVHGVKAVSRPAVTATTAGIGNPIVSFIEDIITGVVAVLAILAPFVAILVAIGLAVGFFLLLRAAWRRLRGRRAQRGQPALPTNPLYGQGYGPPSYGPPSYGQGYGPTPTGSGYGRGARR